MCGAAFRLLNGFKQATDMMDLSPTTVFWLACLAQALGLCTLGAVRCGSSCTEAKWLQVVFFLSMAVLGGAAVAAFQVGSGCWAACGATLAVMAVGAVLDFPQVEHANPLG